MKFKNTYLYIVYKKNKFIFFILTLFVFLCFFTFFTEFRATPIVSWSMYSMPMKNTERFTIYSIAYNDGKKYNLPQPWNHHKRMMVYYTLNWYDQIISNDFQDPHRIIGAHFLSKINLGNEQMLNRLYATPAEVKNYPLWLKNYLEQNINIKIDSASVYKVELSYDENGQLIVDHKQLIIKI